MSSRNSTAITFSTPPPINIVSLIHPNSHWLSLIRKNVFRRIVILSCPKSLKPILQNNSQSTFKNTVILVPPYLNLPRKSLHSRDQKALKIILTFSNCWTETNFKVIFSSCRTLKRQKNLFSKPYSKSHPFFEKAHEFFKEKTLEDKENHASKILP